MSGGLGAGARGRAAVELLGNLSRLRDLPALLAAGAVGLGLVRTELLFPGAAGAGMPGPAEQAATYRRLLAAFPDGPVVIRAFDLGGDKPLPPGGLPVPVGRNPALGTRGLRLLRQRPELLDAQLDAVVGAAPPGARLELLAPMVSDVDDAAWFVAACRATGFRGPVGAMVEVPSAALRAADLLTVVDTVSIGTNDLAQYTFAADRELGSLGRLNDCWQPALLDLIAIVAAAAAATGRPARVCGLAAADPALACVLAGLGVGGLSMGAPALPRVRAALAAHSPGQCLAAAKAAREASTPAAALAAALRELPGLRQGR